MLGVVCGSVSEPTVLCGIDVLQRDGFAQLRGANIALITNHTGRTKDGGHTVDVLAKAPGVKLVCLFAPEHGIRGLLDEEIKDDRDEQTGLPVYSLYNPGVKDGRFRPTDAQLAGVDTIVFDLQDIGTRFYTYVGTMGYAMEAAAAHGLRFVVLDRPNPVGGIEVGGMVAEKKRLSLTAYHRIALRHGMTAGELAGMFNEERKIGAKLDVIWCEGWRRSMLWDQTGLTWVNPSPNMRSLTQAILYPGIGMLEGTNLSVGRGTDTPFELVGAPWIDGRALAQAVNAAGIAGFSCYPIEFTPSSSKYKGEKCSGVAFVVTDRSRFDSIRLGCTLAHELHRLFPDWQTGSLVNLVQNDRAGEAMLSGGYEAAKKAWSRGLSEFVRRRNAFLHYR